MPRALRTRSARSDSSSSRTEMAEDIQQAYHEVSYLFGSIRGSRSEDEARDLLRRVALHPD